MLDDDPDERCVDPKNDRLRPSSRISEARWRTLALGSWRAASLTVGVAVLPARRRKVCDRSYVLSPASDATTAFSSAGSARRAGLARTAFSAAVRPSLHRRCCKSVRAVV